MLVVGLMILATLLAPIALPIRMLIAWARREPNRTEQIVHFEQGRSAEPLVSGRRTSSSTRHGAAGRPTAW